MKIPDLTSQLPLSPRSYGPRQQEQHADFAGVLRNMLSSADSLQKQSDEITEAFVIGQGSVEIHDVVLAAEKARLVLDLTVAVRNKLVEAYQEIMRMQI